MGLRHCPDVSPAAWISGSDLPWQRLVTFGPAGFPAYARLRVVPDPVRDGMDEADAEVPRGWPTEREQLRSLLGTLAAHTTTPDECWFCVWHGWGADLSRLAGSAGGHVHVPGDRPLRSYHLLTGALSAYVDPDGAWSAIPAPVEPAFVWPADQAWCLAFDVDPHFVGIGASTAAIGGLVGRADLDVVLADPDAPQPSYG